MRQTVEYCGGLLAVLYGFCEEVLWIQQCGQSWDIFQLSLIFRSTQKVLNSKFEPLFLQDFKVCQMFVHNPVCKVTFSKHGIHEFGKGLCYYPLKVVIKCLLPINFYYSEICQAAQQKRF